MTQIDLQLNCDSWTTIRNFFTQLAQAVDVKGFLTSHGRGGGPPGALRYTLRVDEPPIAQPDISPEALEAARARSAGACELRERMLGLALRLGDGSYAVEDARAFESYVRGDPPTPVVAPPEPAEMREAAPAGAREIDDREESPPAPLPGLQGIADGLRELAASWERMAARVKDNPDEYGTLDMCARQLRETAYALAPPVEAPAPEAQEEAPIPLDRVLSGMSPEQAEGLKAAIRKVFGA